MCGKVGEEKKFLFVPRSSLFFPFLWGTWCSCNWQSERRGKDYLRKKTWQFRQRQKDCSESHAYVRSCSYVCICTCTCVYVCMYTALYSSVWRSVMQYDAIRCSVMRYNAVCCVCMYVCIQHCILQCDEMWCSVMQCDAVWCGIMQSDKARTNKICRRASSEQRPRTRSCHESDRLV